MPLSNPVRMPIIAPGHRVNHCVIVFESRVAFLKPCSVSGGFVSLWQGKTGHPRSAQDSAICKISFLDAEGASISERPIKGGHPRTCGHRSSVTTASSLLIGILFRDHLVGWRFFGTVTATASV